MDCGFALHPDMVRQQMEGGVVYGLTATLFADVRFENGRAQLSNFDGYPLLTMAQSPTVQTVIVDSGQPLGGIGEVSTPPIAPSRCQCNRCAHWPENSQPSALCTASFWLRGT